MNIERFLQHHQLTRNPFDAEEARHDPVFEQMLGESPMHPDFNKILGRIDRPNTSVVFGEKGSGKTAIRLLIGRRIEEHNRQHPESRTLLVPYDELNPFLDRIVRRARRRSEGDDPAELLGAMRLEDHQDAILSLAVSRLNSGLIDAKAGQKRREGVEAVAVPGDAAGRLSRDRKVDLLVLTALYDAPRGGRMSDRWTNLRKALRFRAMTSTRMLKGAAALLTVLAAVFTLIWGVAAVREMLTDAAIPGWVMPSAVGLIVLAIALWVARFLDWFGVRRLAGQLRREMPAVDRDRQDLQRMLMSLPKADLKDQPWPGRGAGAEESRFELTRALLRVLEALGYTGLMVLVDRIDEPALITGKTERMRPVVWPLFDNKFLQQEGLGLKLLLPLELRHELFRESADFFQEARLDKQSLVDRLSWSGAVLYDLCGSRLSACRAPEAGPMRLTDLFTEEVTAELLVDALDQMQQPRDAFKFLYSVLQEHCRLVPEDQASFQIPRLVVEQVRRQQAQRVQELQRGLTPA